MVPMRVRQGSDVLQSLLGKPDPQEIRTPVLDSFGVGVGGSVKIDGEEIKLEPLSDPVFTSANKAPELRRYPDLREYTEVVGREPIVADATRRLAQRVLQYPMEVEAGRQTPAAQLLAAFSDSVLAGINRLPTVTELLLYAGWWGWRPMQVLWEPRTWSVPNIGGAGGTRIPVWMPRHVIDKPLWAFAWERAPRGERRLIFRPTPYAYSTVGATDVEVSRITAISPEEQAIGWLTPTCGTLDDPYGRGIFSSLWKLVQIQITVSRAYYSGVDREFGRLVVELEPGALAKEDALDTLLEEVRRIREFMAAENVEVRLSGTQGYGSASTKTKDERSFIDAGNALLEALDRRIRTLLSGTTLTSEQSPTDTGSYAMARVHWQGELAYAATLSASTAEQALTELCHSYIRANLIEDPDPEDLPRVRSLIQQAANAEALRTLYDMGAALDAERTQTLLGLSGVVVSDEPLQQAAAPTLPAIPGISGPALPPADDSGDTEDSGQDDASDPQTATRRMALRALEVPTAIGEQRDVQDTVRQVGERAATEALRAPYARYAQQVLRAYRAAAGSDLSLVPQAVTLPPMPDDLLEGLHEARVRLYAAGLSYGRRMLEAEWPAALAAHQVTGDPEDVLWSVLGGNPQDGQSQRQRAGRPRLTVRAGERWRLGVTDDMLTVIRALLGTPTQAPAELLERLTNDLLLLYTTEHRASLNDGDSPAEHLRRLQGVVKDRIETGRAAEELVEGAVGYEAYDEALAAWRREQETRAVYPYLMYVIRNINTRPNHDALKGFAVRSDSAIIPYIMPPNGYNCYCRLIEVSASQAARLGWQGEFPRGTAPLERFRGLGAWDNRFPKEAYVVGIS